ncbi:hypothetical protein [Sorangium sp. So ce1097]|uniref:hypothetical protein n=1 Tax=Sorangium sp. So ce1097 TaxID=3133330 RepID=UPI003F5DD158
MGAVHEVIHLETERRRALKVMQPHLFQSEEMRERFKRKARIAAKVESEHIVDGFDAGVDEATGMPFLVMDLLRGEELGERLKRAGRLPPAEAMTYLYQTALAARGEQRRRRVRVRDGGGPRPRGAAGAAGALARRGVGPGLRCVVRPGRGARSGGPVPPGHGGGAGSRRGARRPGGRRPRDTGGREAPLWPGASRRAHR